MRQNYKITMTLSAAYIASDTFKANYAIGPNGHLFELNGDRVWEPIGCDEFGGQRYTTVATWTAVDGQETN